MYNVTVYFEGKPGKEPIEHVYNNVPEGVTPEQVAQRAQADYPGETIVEIARRPANPGPIVDENAPLAKPASQQIVTRGKVSEADTRRLQMLEAEPPSPSRDREIALLKQGGGAYPNLAGMKGVGEPTAPEPVAPAVDNEMYRLGNVQAAQLRGGGGGQPGSRAQTTYQANQAKWDQMAAEIKTARARLAELAGVRRQSDEEVFEAEALRNRISELESQLPANWAERFGAVGSAAGGILGIPGGGAGSTAGAIGLGAFGTAIGALLDAKQRGMTDEEAKAHVQKSVGVSIAFDAAGGLALYAGGKLVHALAKGTPLYDAAVRRLGGMISRELPGGNVPTLPGRNVFSTTDVDAAAEAGARRLMTDTQAPTAGQRSGTPGWREMGLNQRQPSIAAAAERAQETKLEADIRSTIAGLRETSPSEFTGGEIRSVLERAEQAFKNKTRSVFQELKNLRGKDVEVVDFREVSGTARDLLQQIKEAKVDLTDPKRMSLLRKLAGERATKEEGAGFTFKGAEVLAQKDAAEAAKRMERISPGEAHDLLSELLSLQRDLKSSTEPNSKLLQMVTSFSDKVRKGLDDALASDPRFAEARELYREGMATLYDDALTPVRRGAESSAVKRTLKTGEVEGFDALDRVATFVGKLGDKGLTMAAERGVKNARADVIEANIGTMDALAGLPDLMRKPAFRQSFLRAVPDQASRQLIEELSQAAQIALRGRQAGGAGAQDVMSGVAGAAVAQAAGGSRQVGYAIGRLMTMIGSKGAAEKMRKPVIRTEFGRAAALIRGMAAGTSGTASEEVYKKRLEVLEATVGALEEKMNEQ